MAEYTLYLDEGETIDRLNHRYFVMGGVIIKKTDYSKIEEDVKILKRNVWDNAQNCENYILHEKDITFASNPFNTNSLHKIPSYFGIFQVQEKVDLLYNELSKLVKSAKMDVIAVCLNKHNLYKYYGKHETNHQLSMTIQILVENYCHFLKNKNSTGNICYEFMQPGQNQQIRQRLYELKALGSLYYSSETIQNLIHEIYFQPKSANIAGLQLADFIPNCLAKYASHGSPKNRNYAKTVRKKLYSGNIDLSNKFGLKIFP